MAQTTMITRGAKGSALTWAEADRNLLEGVGVQVQQNKSALISAGIRKAGSGVITLTNGAATITGLGFLDTGPTGYDDYLVYIESQADPSQRFLLLLDTIDDNANATIFAAYDALDENQAGTNYAPAGIWSGPTGAYNAYECLPAVSLDLNNGEVLSIGSNYVDGSGVISVQLGQRNQNANGGFGSVQIGAKNRNKGLCVQVGANNNIAGTAAETTGTDQGVIVGFSNVQTAPDSSQMVNQIVVGTNNQISGARAMILGHNCIISSYSTGNALIASNNSEIQLGTGTNTNNVVGIGLQGIVLNLNNFADTTVVMKLMVVSMPVFADDAAAGAGGVLTDTLYRTPAGVVMIKL
jgi:hypothetical protein